MAFNWMVVYLKYYGISWGIGDLGTNVFASFLLSSAIEFCAQVLTFFFIDHLGRKSLLVFSTFLTGVTCITTAFLTPGIPKTTFGLVGKFGASASFTIIYLYTAELYPTSIRGTAVGFCSMCASFTGILAPQVQYYEYQTYIDVPILVGLVSSQNHLSRSPLSINGSLRSPRIAAHRRRFARDVGVCFGGQH